MNDYLFLALFLSTPFFVFGLMKIAGERFSEINIVSVVVLSLYLFSVVGAFPLYYKLDDYRVAIGISEEEKILRVLFYSCINLLFFLAGVIFYKRLNNVKKFRINSSAIEKSDKKEFFAMVFLLAISGIVFYYYISQIDRIALFVALSEGGKEAGWVRSAMGNDFDGYHWYKLFLNGVGQVVTYAFFASWLIEKKKIYFVFFVIGFLYSAFVALMATEKAPIAWFFIGIFMTYVLAKRNGIVNFRQAGGVALVIVFVLVFAYQYFMGSDSVDNAISSLFSRAFSGSISPAYFYLEYFPFYRDYLWGATFPNPGGIFPHTPVRYTVDIMNWVFPEVASRGVVGSMPTVFWGESYVNFGPIGIPFVAFFVGYLVAAINRWILVIELKPVLLGFYVWVVLELKNLSESGFSGYMYNIPIITMLLLLFFVLGSKGKIGFAFKKKSKNYLMFFRLKNE